MKKFIFLILVFVTSLTLSVSKVTILEVRQNVAKALSVLRAKHNLEPNELAKISCEVFEGSLSLNSVQILKSASMNFPLPVLRKAIFLLQQELVWLVSLYNKRKFVKLYKNNAKILKSLEKNIFFSRILDSISNDIDLNYDQIEFLAEAGIIGNLRYKPFLRECFKYYYELSVEHFLARFRN